MEQKVRVRFAPSPTGPLHIGGVRTALYNYLFARKHGGTFILRIEDTDQTRYVQGAENYIIEALEWCGIIFDEGVSKGGIHAPYRQSERKDMYRGYADAMVADGHAYYAFDTPEELDTARKEKESRKETFQYDQSVRMNMRNSLTLSSDDVKGRIAQGDHYVIRILMPENEDVIVHDLIRGDVVVNTSKLDDKVLFKSDGMPTYHLANVVDDHLMEITHVIRGEEWLPSAPLHVLLYRYLGWDGTIPKFAHLPLLLKPDGQGKLSKRDGDRLGFPVFPLNWISPENGELSSGYRESGYFPEAVVNILALLGWNPGTEQELFTMEEMVQAFSLEKVGKHGSKFDPEKAKWFNHQYLQKKTDEELATLFTPVLKEKEINAELSFVTAVCALVKHRVNFIHELWNQSYFFFAAPTTYDEKTVKDKWKPELVLPIQTIASIINDANPFDAVVTKQAVMDFIKENQLNTGHVMNALRLLIVGAALGPDLFEIIKLIGKEEAVRRINNGIERL
ncbi:MAG: glutamate--tRNA ligase [Bacteroidota bacterium]